MPISPLRNHDVDFWPLTGTGGDNPAFAFSGQLNFNLRDVPALNGGKLCNHLLGIIVEIRGTMDNSNSTAVRVNPDDLTRGFISDVAVENAWHGSPVSSNHAKGALLDVIEWASSGYQFWQGVRLGVPAGYNGTFRHQFFLPLYAGSLLKSHHTALPVALYKNAQLRINTAASTVLASICSTIAFTSGTVRATAVMVPQREITLGPGTEWIRYTYPVASASAEVVQLDSFGNQSALTGTEQGAGLLNMFWMDESNGQGGGDLVSNITRLAVPFRGIPPMLTVRPFINRMNVLAGISFPDNYNASATASFATPFPYVQGASAYTTTFPLAMNPRFLPIVMSAPEQELSKVQTVDGTTSFHLAASSLSGEHVTLAQHVRSWSPASFESAKRELIDSGVVDAVCGTRDVEWTEKMARKQLAGELREDHLGKLRYLPVKLVPRAA